VTHAAPPIQSYLGLFFGLLAIIFLLLALRRASASALAAKAYSRMALIFAVVSAALLLSNRFLR
jgi:hypothetical protein